ncbi:MAG: hypothetical protein P4L69_01300 [Desulfosporosinus sp.]|nr:hypothetical protein [Desulfosporosinus sp.]
MEAYFHTDPRIRDWINQIMEKIFTVCILTGADSDAEFQKGCQIILKLTTLLKEIPTFPAEFLEDGVKQLLEQQLPDARVINNFPTFQATLDRMLNEGILKATVSTKEMIIKSHDNCTEMPLEASQLESNPESVITKAEAQALADGLALAKALAQAETQAKADIQALAEALAQAETQAKADAQALAEALAQAETQAKVNAQALAEALAQAETQAKADAQALADALAQAETQAKADAQALADALAQAETQAKADAQALAEALAQAETQAKADAQALAEALAQAETQAKADAQALAEALAQAETQAKADAQALADALVLIDVLTNAEKEVKADALVLAEALAQAEAQAKADAQALADAVALIDVLTNAEKQVKADALVLAEALAQAETQAKADAQALSEALAQADVKFEAVTEAERNQLAEPISSTNDYFIASIHSKASQVFRPTQVPKQADLLKVVLSNMFPKGAVYWNQCLMGQTFLAQVEDILICLHDPEHPCDLKKFNKDGWKVLVCSMEDLTFPRRLERKIRLIQRSGKTSGVEKERQLKSRVDRLGN